MRLIHGGLRTIVRVAPESFRRGVARLPFSRFHHITRRLMDGDVTIRWRGLRIRLNPGEMLGFYTYLFGDFARVEIDQLIELCQGRTVVFDVGANRCWVAMAIAQHCKEATVVAFEADPAIARLAEESRALNPNAAPRVRVMAHAIGAIDGEVSFTLSEEGNSGVGRVATGGIGPSITVPCKAIDTVCRETGMYPDVVKIDVEGAELSVLKGMTGLLRTRPPRAIMVELHGFYMTDFADFYREIHDILVNAGYCLLQAGEEERFRPADSWTTWPSRVHVAALRE